MTRKQAEKWIRKRFAKRIGVEIFPGYTTPETDIYAGDLRVRAGVMRSWKVYQVERLVDELARSALGENPTSSQVRAVLGRFHSLPWDDA